MEQQHKQAIEQRLQTFIDRLWNSRDARLRLAFRRVFFDVRPTPVDALVNLAILLHKETPEA